MDGSRLFFCGILGGEIRFVDFYIPFDNYLVALVCLKGLKFDF